MRNMVKALMVASCFAVSGIYADCSEENTTASEVVVTTEDLVEEGQGPSVRLNDDEVESKI
ncbi:MAG: hypothetical protein JSS32_04025 [Verrucomicrobia bacterium]|nr:hypothetical protein [Verrucomicrobiota bacterium]